MIKCFPYCCLNGLRTSFYFAHKHGALNRGQTKIRKPGLVSVCCQSSLRLFSNEKNSQLILYDLEKMAEILSNECIFLRDPIADRSEWTAPRHAKLLLQLDM